MKARIARSALRQLLPLALPTAAFLLPLGAQLLADAAPRPPALARARAADADRPAQGTPGGGGLPDLRWVGWRYDNVCFNGQRWLTLSLGNRGPGTAGRFSVQDSEVSWRVEGLAPGQTITLPRWGKYPAFPLVIDPYDEVQEGNEGNNVLGPRPNVSWTPTPEFTQPRPCPTRTPVPSRTPSGLPSLPDLVIVRATWWEETITRDSGACRPERGGWLYTVTVRNDGSAAAGAFEVGTGGFWGSLWRIDGLSKFQEVTLAGSLRGLPGPLAVDAQDDIEESREDNNTWLPPFNGTPTPARTGGGRSAWGRSIA